MKKTGKLLIGLLIIGIIGTAGIFLWFQFGTTGEDSLNQDLDRSGTTTSKGELTEMDSSHWGMGEVQIVRLSSGEYQLHFIDVEISDGPDLYVYLSENNNFSSVNDDPGVVIDLGKLIGQKGTFSYNLPSNFDPSKTKSVVIWCNAAAIVFSYADLQSV